MVEFSLITGDVLRGLIKVSIRHPYNGIAKSKEVAEEIHSLLYGNAQYPELLVQVGKIRWLNPNENAIQSEIWILNSRLLMN